MAFGTRLRDTRPVNRPLHSDPPKIINPPAIDFTAALIELLFAERREWERSVGCGVVHAGMTCDEFEEYAQTYHLMLDGTHQPPTRSSFSGPLGNWQA